MSDRSLLLFLAPFAAGLTVHVACVESDETPSPSLSLDGGGFDASSPDVVSTTEASVDAGVDSADAAAPGVTVVAVRDGVPAPGVTIVFGDLLTGAVLETKQTDATGRASREVVGGLHVTAVFGTPTSPELVTIMAAEPGDVVTIVDPSASFGTDPSVQITGVPQPTPVGATGYEITSGRCGFYTTTFPGVYELGPDCMSGSIFPILVEALDNTSKPVAFTSVASVTMPDGGVDGGLPVAPTAPWAATDERTVSVVGADAGTAVWLTQSEVVSGVPFFRSSSVLVPDDGGAAAVTLTGHPGFTTVLQHEATERGSTLQGTAAYRAIATRTSTLGADAGVTLDFSKALPAITTIEIDGGVVNRPTVSWTASSGITEGDGIISRLTWYDPQDGGLGFIGHWTIVAPPLSSLIATPALPAAVAAYAPSADAQLYEPTLALVEVSTLPGYRELRQGSALVRPTTNLLNDNYGAVAPILPLDGTVRLTAATRNGD